MNTSKENPKFPSHSGRVEAARNGDLPLRELTPEELAVFNAAVDEAIARRIAIIDWPGMLSRCGLYSVSLDKHGQIVVRHPRALFAPRAQTRKDRI